MAHHQTCRALLILFTFQLYTVSLCNASPQSFGPLIRDRAIRDRKQTSEEDLNANIERIYRKDFKTTVPPKEQNTDEVEPSPTELVARSAPTRPRRPIENNEQNAMVYVYRDADGKLVPKFANSQPVATTPRNPPTISNSDSQPTNESPGTLVLKIAAPSNATVSEIDEPVFADGSYPNDYPFDVISKIIDAHKDNYEHWFDKKIKHDPLATRANSEADKFLCSSEARTEYPTYSAENDRHIINVKGFYQPVVYEICSNNGNDCSKSNTAKGYKLVCMQTYRDYKMFVAPPKGAAGNKFDFIDIRYPACCKCAQILAPKTTTTSGP